MILNVSLILSVKCITFVPTMVQLSRVLNMSIPNDKNKVADDLMINHLALCNQLAESSKIPPIQSRTKSSS